MSLTAPWLPLAVDWYESEMWDALPEFGIDDKATDGERLAWVILLCEAKKKGRGGKVTIRKSALQDAARLSARSVDGMLKRAQKCGAIEIDGNAITLINWRSYQQKMGGSKASESGQNPKTPKSSETSPTTTTTTTPTTTTPKPPVATNGKPATEAEPVGPEWEGVAEELLNLGLAKAADCVRAVATAGCNPQQVQNLIEFWRGQQPAWGVGALYQRLLVFRPGQSFFELWPPKAEAATQAERQAAKHKSADATRAKLAAEQREFEQATKAEAAENARLEKAHGKKLDGMTRPQLLDFIAAAWPESWTLYHGRLPKDGPIPGTLRRELLKAIDDRSNEGSQL